MDKLSALWSIGGFPLLTLIVIAGLSAGLVIRESLMLLTSPAPAHTSLPIVGVLAVITPLVGLLGTVIGLVTVFTAEVDAHAVAGGISQALLTTQVGLIVAIPTRPCSPTPPALV